MTVRPISFSAPMVRALLDGRKTQTRRLIKNAGCRPEFCGGRYDNRNDPEAWGWEDTERGEWVTLDQFRRYRFVPFAPGDRLWVREAWRSCVSLDHLTPKQVGERESEAGYKAPWGPVFYEADGAVSMWPCPPFTDATGRYRHARFMPRWASRLTLRVTDVRVQRVQEISPRDILAEGVDVPEHHRGGLHDPHRWRVDHFAPLWNSLHGPDAWTRNDWVCALAFDVIRQNVDEVAP